MCTNINIKLSDSVVNWCCQGTQDLGDNKIFQFTKVVLISGAAA